MSSRTTRSKAQADKRPRRNLKPNPLYHSDVAPANYTDARCGYRGPGHYQAADAIWRQAKEDVRQQAMRPAAVNKAIRKELDRAMNDRTNHYALYKDERDDPNKIVRHTIALDRDGKENGDVSATTPTKNSVQRVTPQAALAKNEERAADVVKPKSLFDDESPATQRQMDECASQIDLIAPVPMDSMDVAAGPNCQVRFQLNGFVSL